ncbi:MAG: hypothetical protein KY437_02310 [Actinobacteria bacterium]|nr:hypothetical protein [Actinomycetota bacterium]
MVLSLRVAITVAIVVLAAACGTLFPSPAAEPLPSAPAPVVDAGAGATFTDGTARIIEVEVWRDQAPVMRGAEPPCADLCTRVRIATSGFLPRILQVDELWVVRDGRAARFGEIVPQPEEPGLVVTGQRGPRLGDGAAVSVVARIVRSDGTARLVRSDQATVSVRE